MKLRVRHKLYLMVLLPLVITLSMAVSAKWLVDQVNDTASKIAEEHLPPILRLNQIATLYTQGVIDVAHKARGQMLIWGEAGNTLKSAREEITRHWEAYRAGNLTTEEMALLEQHNETFRQVDELIDTLTSYIDEQSAYSMGNFVDLKLYPGIDPVLALVKQLVEIKNVQASSSQQEASQIADRADWVLLIAFGLSAMVSSVVGLWLFISLIRPIRQLRNVITQVEHDQDLSLRTDLPPGDELGELSQAFDSLITRLSKQFMQLQRMGESLSRTSDTLAGAATDTQDKAIRQHQEISEVIEALQQVDAAASHVLGAVNETSEATQEAGSSAQLGNGVVVETISALKKLAGEMNQSVQSMDRLQGHSEEIGSVLSVIRDIAEQTNLLALNAAIEAARAGEQGRGFAVVADEVRHLASRTASSTREIQQIIENIQSGTVEAAREMHTGTDTAATSVQTAERAGDALARIVVSFDRIRSHSESITEAAHGQLETNAQVNTRMGNVSQLADETTQISREASDSSHQVSQLAESMQQILVQYQTA